MISHPRSNSGKSLWFMEIPLAHVPRPQTESMGLSGLWLCWLCVCLVGEISWLRVCGVNDWIISAPALYFMWFYDFPVEQLQYQWGAMYQAHQGSPTPLLQTHWSCNSPCLLTFFQLRPCWWKDLTAKKLPDVRRLNVLQKTQDLNC